jgi:hypothetical protein
MHVRSCAQSAVFALLPLLLQQQEHASSHSWYYQPVHPSAWLVLRMLMVVEQRAVAAYI